MTFSICMRMENNILQFINYLPYYSGNHFMLPIHYLYLYIAKTKMGRPKDTKQEPVSKSPGFLKFSQFYTNLTLKTDKIPRIYF